MKKLAILGSTGSIGRQTLEVADWFPQELQISALTAGGNIHLLAAQAQKYQPAFVVIADEKKYQDLKALLPGFKGEIAAGAAAVQAAASETDCDTVVGAISGVAGLLPIWAALEAGKAVALANKEVLVAAGAPVMELVKSKGLQLLPVDSEHSAIFQCLEQEGEALHSLIITASGGPFRGKSRAQLAAITPAEALAHPTWNMGQKISIDSATLMNKGLEVIEAHWLFDVDYADIRVVVHRESIIHSLVQYADGSILAHLGAPDMRVPIQYALTWPKRRANRLENIDLAAIGKLHFEEPDTENFPCLSLAYGAGEKGGTFPAVLNAANEELVWAFLRGEIPFGDIPRLNEKILSRHKGLKGAGLTPYLEADAWARAVLHKDYLKTERG